MSQENVDKTLDYIDAYNRRDFDAATHWFDPDVEWVLPDLQAADSCQGPKAIIRFWKGLDETFDELTLKPQESIDAGDRVAVRLRHYAEAQRRFGVHWSILASINFVESAFGRVRSASEAGARGPMQFLPSTWRVYGMGGDIDDPHDAIMAAANYLRRAGAPSDYGRALFAYNHSTHYVRAVRRLASRMRRDERAFRAYYAWQVYVLTPNGTKRVTGPGVG